MNLFPKKEGIEVLSTPQLREMILDRKRIKIFTRLGSPIMSRIEERHFFGTRNHLFMLVPLLREGITVAFVPNTKKTRRILKTVQEEIQGTRLVVSWEVDKKAGKEDFFVFFAEEESHLVGVLWRFLYGQCHTVIWQEEVEYDERFLRVFFELEGHEVDLDVDTFKVYHWIANQLED